jgi:hypothetical protein
LERYLDTPRVDEGAEMTRLAPGVALVRRFRCLLCRPLSRPIPLYPDLHPVKDVKVAAGILQSFGRSVADGPNRLPDGLVQRIESAFRDHFQMIDRAQENLLQKQRRSDQVSKETSESSEALQAVADYRATAQSRRTDGSAHVRSNRIPIPLYISSGRGFEIARPSNEEMDSWAWDRSDDLDYEPR